MILWIEVSSILVCVCLRIVCVCLCVCVYVCVCMLACIDVYNVGEYETCLCYLLFLLHSR